jgi:hypothetical protein
MKRILIAAVLLSYAWHPTGNAQAAKGPKILLAPPPGPISWTIRYSYKKPIAELVEEKKEDLAAKSLEMTDLTRPEKSVFIISKPLSSRVVNLEGGTKEEAIYYGDFEFKMSPRGRGVLVSDLKSYPSIEQLFRTRFPGVDWVKPNLFVKVEEIYGESCAYFKDGNPEKFDPNSDKMDEILDASKYEIREAWFSVKTGLPVAFKSGGTEGKYQFESAENLKVSAPGPIREKINQHAKYMAYIKQREAAASVGNGS